MASVSLLYIFLMFVVQGPTALMCTFSVSSHGADVSVNGWYSLGDCAKHAMRTYLKIVLRFYCIKFINYKCHKVYFLVATYYKAFFYTQIYLFLFSFLLYLSPGSLFKIHLTNHNFYHMFKFSFCYF